MSTLFNKSTTVTKTTETAKKEPSEFFINIGFTKVYGDTERFINIPVVITADNIQAGIEKVQKSCSQNSPDDWKEFTEDRMVLGQDIVQLFSEIPVGQMITNMDIPDDHNLSYLKNLEVQFVHRDTNKAPVVEQPKDVVERRKSFGKR